MRGKVARAIRRVIGYDVNEDRKNRKFVLVETSCFDVIINKDNKPERLHRYYMMHNSELRERYKKAKKFYRDNRDLFSKEK